MWCIVAIWSQIAIKKNPIEPIGMDAYPCPPPIIPENPDATYPYNWPDLNLPVLRIEKEIEGGAPFFISGFDFELRDESNAHVNFSDFYCIIILS